MHFYLKKKLNHLKNNYTFVKKTTAMKTENQIDVNKILFRCSSIGEIMVEGRNAGLTENQENELNELINKEKRTTKQEEKLQYLIAKKNAPPELSQTTKSYLVEKFVNEKYKRERDIYSKYTAKGLMVEEDSLTLYSRYLGKLLTKNEERLQNDFICGTPDVIKELVIDIKSSWDIFTFFETKEKPLNQSYYWQLQGYMALTGAEEAVLAYCLTDTPEVLINDEKRKLLFNGGFLSELSPEYVEACEKLDIKMKYDDIDINERIFEIKIKRNEEDIQRIYKRVQECREYMKTKLFKY